jgi:hypothetical protein
MIDNGRSLLNEWPVSISQPIKSIMKVIYFIKDETGFKYTAMMYTNKKAAEKRLEEMRKEQPKRTFSIDEGYAFSW